jgi:3-phenylpropionate/cinnamic acid dioxygenase small subunit
VYRNNWEADWSAGKHYIGNVLASRQDDGLVRSRAYFQAVFIRSDRTSKVIGRYDDLLEDVDGRLLIKHKRINVEGVVDLPESAREWGGYRLWSR